MNRFFKFIPLAFFSAHLFSTDSYFNEFFGPDDNSVDESLDGEINTGYGIPLQDAYNYQDETDNRQAEPLSQPQTAVYQPQEIVVSSSSTSTTPINASATEPQPIPPKIKLIFKQPVRPNIEPPPAQGQTYNTEKLTKRGRKRVIGSPEHESFDNDAKEIPSVTEQPPAAKKLRHSYNAQSKTAPKAYYDEQHNEEPSSEASDKQDGNFEGDLDDEESGSDIESSHKPIDYLDEDRPHNSTSTTTTPVEIHSHPYEDSTHHENDMDDARDEDNDEGADTSKAHTYFCFWTGCEGNARFHG